MVTAARLKFGKCMLLRTRGKSREKKGELVFIGKRKELGEPLIIKESIGRNWKNSKYGGFSVAGLLQPLIGCDL